jgi:hypothetical protein
MKPRDRRFMPVTVPLVLALVVGMTLAGCTGGGSLPPGTGLLPGATSGGTPGTPGAASAAASQIPPGREIAEGGGGPVSYTFREEWRRALGTAQAWRSGAYLVTAVGQMVNDDGVPNSWRLTFADKAAPDAVLLLDIDPWGKLTGREEVTGSGATGLVGDSTKPIPYDVIDSDQAVTVGKKELGATYNLAKTKDPLIALNYDRKDGSGPYWSYVLFYESTAEYVTARIDARTGEAAPAP